MSIENTYGSRNRRFFPANPNAVRMLSTRKNSWLKKAYLKMLVFFQSSGLWVDGLVWDKSDRRSQCENPLRNSQHFAFSSADTKSFWDFRTA
jgi:hypothetical protein